MPDPQFPDSLAIIAADFARLPPRVGALTGVAGERARWPVVSSWVLVPVLGWRLS